ncbi:metallophosphoesterase [Streptomyces sp. NPDC006487]|uniref:metallophosphoesterase family protein n=1 Tax=Streptomyces sp. NPDC006487 TaxID=3364748 RepID=UPI003698116E
MLLLAGDLTRHGTPAEARVVAAEVAGLAVPVVAVLGNHDYQSDRQEEVTRELKAAGVHVLEGDGVALRLAGTTVGVAGTKGFCGGFSGRSGSEFGEPEMKAGVGNGVQLAQDRVPGPAFGVLEQGEQQGHRAHGVTSEVLPFGRQVEEVNRPPGERRTCGVAGRGICDACRFGLLPAGSRRGRRPCGSPGWRQQCLPTHS